MRRVFAFLNCSHARRSKVYRTDSTGARLALMSSILSCSFALTYNSAIPTSTHVIFPLSNLYSRLHPCWEENMTEKSNTAENRDLGLQFLPAYACKIRNPTFLYK